MDTGRPTVQATERPTPKRGANERQGIHSWLPYYAGFSEAFVEDAIGRFGLGTDSILLDPMGGSGTTACAAQKKGISTIAVDINPATVAINRAKNHALAMPKEVAELSVRIMKKLKNLPRSQQPHLNGLSKWLPNSIYGRFERIRAILKDGSSKAIPFKKNLARLATGLQSPTLRLTDLVEAALLRHLRAIHPPVRSKNPTWIKASDAQDELSVAVLDGWVKVARESAEDLVSYFGSSTPESAFISITGDARKLDLQDASVDAIITSPPYLTRIDYAVSTMPELLLLGYEIDPSMSLRDLRCDMMGTSCIRDEELSPATGLGKHVLSLLKTVLNHGSYAAKNYYWKTFVQYFNDALRIVNEMVRVLKPGGQAALVVQDSWFKDLHVNLADCYVELGVKAGMKASVDASYLVTNVLTNVNVAAQKYKKGGVEEHVVIYEKKK